MVIEMYANYVADIDDDELFQEVRTGLQFTDLRVSTTPNKHMLKQFQQVLPTHAVTFAERWRITTANQRLLGLMKETSNRKTSAARRRHLVDQLDQEVRKAGKQGWRRHQ